MVMRRNNALGFSIQLPKFAQNTAEDLESEVCPYFASISSCTNHCVSTIWLGSFLKNHRKAQELRRLTLTPTLTRVAVLSVRLGETPRRGPGSHYDKGSVKSAIRALRVGSSEYSGLWKRQ